MDEDGDEWLPEEMIYAIGDLESLDAESWTSLFFETVDNACRDGIKSTPIERLGDFFKIVWGLKCTGYQLAFLNRLYDFIVAIQLMVPGKDTKKRNGRCPTGL